MKDSLELIKPMEFNKFHEFYCVYYLLNLTLNPSDSLPQKLLIRKEVLQLIEM